MTINRIKSGRFAIGSRRFATGSRRLAIGAAASAALFAGFGLTAPAMADEPTSEQLLQKIQELQKQVQTLQTTQDSTSRKLDAAEVDAAVARVLDDADQRSDLLSMQGFTAGYDNGFKLQSEDGEFVLQPVFQFQYRFVENLVDGDTNDFNSINDVNDTFDDFQTDEGFEIRRMKFGVRGNFYQPLKYNFKWGTDRFGGGLTLEDAEIQWEFADGWSLHAGQFKDPVNFEETTSSGRQMAVERSFINEVLGGGISDRIQGAGLIYEQDNLRAEVVAHDGLNTDNTPYFRSGGPGLFADAPQWGAAARAEYVIMGDGFGPSRDFATIAGNATDEPYWLVGAGGDYTDYSDEITVLHTVDTLYKSGQGPGTFSLFGAYYGLYSETQADSGYNWGVEAQAAYAFTQKVDGFLRGSYIRGNDEGFIGDDDFYEFTVGGNYYLANHAAKITIDATYLPEGSPTSNSGIGAVAADGQDQIIFRGQFQLLL